MFVFVHAHGFYLSCSFYAIYGWEENMIMCLMWTRLLQYFGTADVAQGRVDPSLPWFCCGKSRHDGGSKFPTLEFGSWRNFVFWNSWCVESGVVGRGGRSTTVAWVAVPVAAPVPVTHVVLRVAHLSGMLVTHRASFGGGSFYRVRWVFVPLRLCAQIAQSCPGFDWCS